jgi:hypothetical protein
VNTIQQEGGTFNSAWDCEDPVIQDKWRIAIKEEFHDMKLRKVWDVISKEDMPKKRRCIKCKWIFKI